MKQIISNLLERYELGRINRRQLIQGLAALAAAPRTVPAEGSTFRGVGLNHIAIRVTNVQRSRDFYQKHLGLPLIHQSETNCFLGLGKNFLTLFQNPNPGLDHYCIAIENFKADAVVETLKRQGLKPDRPSGTDRVYFPDSDGLTVQLFSVDHHARRKDLVRWSSAIVGG
jgi:catechol 2,3-dioxygenase-like lactoylglutathione lyase family enzyme